MTESSFRLSRRDDYYLFGFVGLFLWTSFSLWFYLFLGGRHFLQAFVEKCLAQCSALMTLSFSAMDGVRLSLSLGLFVLLLVSLAKSLSDVRHVRKFTRSLHKMEIPPRFGRLLKECGLQSDRVFLFPSWLGFACTAGLFSPNIYVSTNLFDSLSDEEVKAVLRHEQCHAQRRDPLRGMLIGLFARFFFFIPQAARLLHGVRRDLELIADSHYLAFSPSPDTLASALVKVRRDNLARTRIMTGFAEEDFLEERLNRLLNLKTGSAATAWTSRRTLSQMATGLVLAISLAFLILPVGNAFPKVAPWVCRHTSHESCCPSGGGGGTHAHCRSELGGTARTSNYR